MKAPHSQLRIVSISIALAIGALAAEAQQGQAAQAQLTDPNAACLEDLPGQGNYQFQSSSSGQLSGVLNDEDGEAAYLLQADLTSYLVVSDPNGERFGGIEGTLLPAAAAGILPVDLAVRGTWAQQPGMAAHFRARILEVNAVTGTVYRDVGEIRGTFMAAEGLGLSLGNIPPPPASGDIAAHKPRSANGGLHSASVSYPGQQGSSTGSLALKQKSRRLTHQAAKKAPFAPQQPIDDDPPFMDREQEVPDRQQPDALGSSTGRVVLKQKARRLTHQAAKKAPFAPQQPIDDDPPIMDREQEIPDRQQPDALGSSTGRVVLKQKARRLTHQAAKKAPFAPQQPIDDDPPFMDREQEIPDRQQPDALGSSTGHVVLKQKARRLTHQAAKKAPFAPQQPIDDDPPIQGRTRLAPDQASLPVAGQRPEVGLFFATWGICY